MKEIFEHKDYKVYLAERFSTSGPTRGLRSKLALHLGYQVAHISQILNGPGHFTLEHAALIDEFLGHTADESEAFLLLVHWARAGNRTLAVAYRRRFEVLREERRRARIKRAETVVDDEAELALYYRSWHVAAAHILLMLAPQDARAVAVRLGMPLRTAESALTTLSKLGMAAEHRGSYAATPRRWHLPPESPMAVQHQLNWRRRTILNLERGPQADDLHYSGPMAISAESARAIRALLVDAIERMEPLIAAPGEVVTRALCLDFFAIDVPPALPR